MILEGKTQKGKNRIRELGIQWVILKTTNRVIFDPRPGPWLFIAPVNNGSASRWVHSKNDRDFEIISLTF